MGHCASHLLKLEMSLPQCRHYLMLERVTDLKLLK